MSLEKDEFDFWLILELFARITTFAVIAVMLANYWANKPHKEFILPILLIFFLLWTFRPFFIAIKDFKLQSKKNNLLTIERDLLPLDIQKLTKEDRRVLIDKNSSEFMFNKNMIQQNIFMIVSIFALFTSLIAIILPLEVISDSTKSLVVIFFILAALYLIISCAKSIFLVKKQQKIIEFGYNEIFKLHFNYSLKKVDKK